MSRWSEQISKQPIHTLLQVMIDQAELPANSIDPAYAIEKSRFIKVIRMIRQVVSSLDPDITPIDTLINLHNTLHNHGVVNTINQYASSRDSSLFHSANEQINPSLSYVYQLSSLKFSRSTRRADIDAASSSFAKFAEVTHQKIAEFESDIRSSISAVQDAAKEISEMKLNAEIIITDFNQKILGYENRDSDMFITHKDVHATAERAKQSEFDKSIAKNKTDAEIEIKKISEQMEAEASEIQEKFNHHIEHVLQDSTEKHRAVLDLYQLVAADSVTGGHKRIADREYLQAQGWRWATIVLILATIGWLGFNIFGVTPVLDPERLFWVQIVKSISLTALLVSLAVYASKQSTFGLPPEK